MKTTSVALAAVLLLGTAAAETPTAQETPVVQDAGDAYRETWEWCTNRFPYREDLQEACKWGAYEMLPAREARETRETREEVIAWPRV